MVRPAVLDEAELALAQGGVPRTAVAKSLSAAAWAAPAEAATPNDW